MAEQQTNLLDIQGLSYQIKGNEILTIPNFQVQRGAHLLLLGPSGCGKTTLLYLMAGLLKPTSGSVAFEGTNYQILTADGLDQLRAEKFGFVFQKIHLIGHLTVIQNIEMAQSVPNLNDILALLEHVGLKDKGHQSAKNLSQGEAQRVALARALINKPAILYADEPTSALDDANAAQIIALMMQYAQQHGMMIIASTHDARIKKHFNHLWDMTS